MSEGGTAGGRATHFARGEAVLWRQTDDRVIVLPPGASDATVLTGTAMAVWQILEHPLSLEETVAALAGTYQVSIEEVRADMGPALERLCVLGVLEHRETLVADRRP